MIFRELTRKNKQLPDAECIELLKNERRGVLAVNGDGGYPYAAPMNHYYNEADGCIYFHCGRARSHRLDALAASDKVCFCVCENGVRAEGDWELTVRSAVIFGRIEIVDDLDAIREICAALSRRFTDDEAYIEREIATFAESTYLLRLRPENICGKTVKES